MRLSVVTTLYRSEGQLPEFYRRIKREAEAIAPEHEIVLVNDGSPDRSLDVAIALSREDSRVRVVDLSRNFGHHRAILTGLSYAKGDLIFLIDCDLEEDPALLGRFYQAFSNSKADVLFGVQERRKGGFFERLSGSVFYKTLRILTALDFPDNISTVRLMSRRYVESLLRHRESEVFLAGLFHITGFDQIPVPIQKGSRGSTTYTLTKRIALFVNSITSFSDKPLVFIFYMGAAISLAAGVWICDLIIRKFFLRITVTGWTSLMVSIWLLGGLIIFSLGVLGIFLSKVFIEIKGRPRSIVRAVYGCPDS